MPKLKDSLSSCGAAPGHSACQTLDMDPLPLRPLQVIDLSRAALAPDLRPNRMAFMLKTCRTFIRGEGGRTL